MRSRAAIVGILALTALTLATDAALALPVSSAGGLKNFCLNQVADGIWFPPNQNGVFGCLWGSGRGFFCGGALRGCTSL